MFGKGYDRSYHHKVAPGEVRFTEWYQGIHVVIFWTLQANKLFLVMIYVLVFIWIKVCYVPFILAHADGCWVGDEDFLFDKLGIRLSTCALWGWTPQWTLFSGNHYNSIHLKVWPQMALELSLIYIRIIWEQKKSDQIWSDDRWNHIRLDVIKWKWIIQDWMGWHAMK